MTFPVDDKLTAYDLNNRRRVAYAPGTAQINQQADFFDAGGLSVDVAPEKQYALDGFIAYESSTTGDIRLALTVPADSSGHWGMHGLHVASTNPGALEAFRLDSFGDASGFSIGAAGAGTGLGAWLIGYVRVGGLGGRVTVRFTQAAFDGANTIIRAGSWLRVTPLD